MKKIKFPIVILFILLIGCQDDKEALSLIEERYLTEELKACEDEICPKIEIQLLKAENDSPIAHTINETTERIIAQNLSMSPDQEYKSIDEGVSHFIKDYRAAENEFPEDEAAQEYEFTTNSSISLETENLLSIELQTYSYWGGAHGYADTKYLNFDLKSNRYLENNTLIKDQDKFKALVEKQFRKQQNIAPEASINDGGYFFEDDTFILPNTIGFDENYVILLYNPYEVAPYAEGQIIVEIPHKDAAPFFSIRLE